VEQRRRISLHDVGVSGTVCAVTLCIATPYGLIETASRLLLWHCDCCSNVACPYRVDATRRILLKVYSSLTLSPDLYRAASLISRVSH
jgi:hypothetical protein